MEYKFHLTLLILYNLLNKFRELLNIKNTFKDTIHLSSFFSLGQTYSFKCSVNALCLPPSSSFLIHSTYLFFFFIDHSHHQQFSRLPPYKRSMKDNNKAAVHKKLIFLRLFIQYVFSYKVMSY